jgi:DNA polymerase delta subunit 1
MAKRGAGAATAPSFAEEIAKEFGDTESETSWPRPTPPADWAAKAVAFQWIDIDNYDGEPLTEHPRRGAGLILPGAHTGVVPILRVFGVTGSGNSVCAHVHGYTPYFWTAPPGPMGDADVIAFKDNLEKQLAGSKRGRMDECVRAVKLIPDKQSLLGYHGGRKQPMLQIYVATHNLVATAKGVLERGFSFGRFPPRSVSGCSCPETRLLSSPLPRPSPCCSTSALRPASPSSLGT